MKTHYVVLVLLSFILFTNISCDEDEDNNQEQEQVELTSTNYIYEGDLRKFYLETKNAELETQIEIWQQIPDSDPSYEEIQISIEQANEEIDANYQEIDAIASPSEAFLIINPVIPPIPVPLPCLCLDVYNTIENLVFQAGNDQGSIMITSVSDQSIIAATNANTQISTIPNTDGLGRFQSFNIAQENFTGQAIITIQTDNGSYSILANFQNLQ